MVTSRPVVQPDVAPLAHTADEIFHACGSGDAGLAEQLIRAAAAEAEDGDASALLGARNDSGETLLHCAADAGLLGAVTALLAAGVPVDAVEAEAGQTALHYAVALGRGDVIAALRAGGASASVADLSGATPLDGAAGDPAVLAALQGPI